MDFDLISALVGAAVPIAIGASIKYLPKLAAKTDNKIDDALAAVIVKKLEDPETAKWLLRKAQEALNIR